MHGRIDQAFTTQFQNDQKQVSDELYHDMLPQGIPILEKGQSLEQDMLFGWQPRIKMKGPVPIKFDQQILDTIVDELLQPENFQYELIYLGPRFVDSYEVHEAYSCPETYQFNHTLISQNQKLVINKQRKDSRKKMNRPFVGMKVLSENDLQFDSNFESGNLDIVVKIGESEYDLFMRVDSNTTGHFTWYNFKITNTKKNQIIKINICNMIKFRCLYERGMRPFIQSQKEFQIHNKDWQQQGENVKFQQKELRYKFLTQYYTKKFYQLSFEVNCKYDDDVLHISYGVPYTFTKLLNYLKVLEDHQYDYVKQSKFCQSLAGLNVPKLTIGSNLLSNKTIVVSGRIHPGESNGSWMIQGFLDFVTGNTEEARELRQIASITVIPMINPDGVILGNYRTGLAGRDLNRQFKNTDKLLYPTVSELKELINEIQGKNSSAKQLQPFAFLDFHGHSVKKSVFTYGPEFPLFSPDYLKCRILPKLLQQKTDMFRYWSGIWRINKCKQQTSRAVFFKKNKIVHCFTVEASNGSYYKHDTKETIDFLPSHWVLMGYHIGECLYELVKMTIQLELFEEDKKLSQQIKKQTLIETKLQELNLIKASKNVTKLDMSRLIKTQKLKKRSFHDTMISQEPEMLRIMKKILEEENEQLITKKQNDEGMIDEGSDSLSSDNDIDDKEIIQLKKLITQSQNQFLNINERGRKMGQNIPRSKMAKKKNRYQKNGALNTSITIQGSREFEEINNFKRVQDPQYGTSKNNLENLSQVSNDEFKFFKMQVPRKNSNFNIPEFMTFKNHNQKLMQFPKTKTNKTNDYENDSLIQFMPQFNIEPQSKKRIIRNLERTLKPKAQEETFNYSYPIQCISSQATNNSRAILNGIMNNNDSIYGQNTLYPNLGKEYKNIEIEYKNSKEKEKKKKNPDIKYYLRTNSFHTSNIEDLSIFSRPQPDISESPQKIHETFESKFTSFKNNQLQAHRQELPNYSNQFKNYRDKNSIKLINSKVIDTIMSPNKLKQQ